MPHFITEKLSQVEQDFFYHTTKLKRVSISSIETLYQIESYGILPTIFQYYTFKSTANRIPNDVETGAGSKLRDVDEKISNSFKQCIDAAYVFLKANDEQSARATFEKGHKLYLFATDTTRNIQLDTDDIPYLDTLKLKLKQ